MDSHVGFLRPEVFSNQENDFWIINFGLVELRLPILELKNQTDLLRFLLRECSSTHVASSEHWVKNLISFFNQQGALYQSDHEIRSFDGLSKAHCFFSNIWYGYYYSHPVWSLMRKHLTPEIFARWAKRTYRLSKSAGATASRSVVMSRHEEVRKAFLKSAIEEYSHHSSFYSLPDLLSKLSPSDPLSYIASPGCMAFDDQMLAISGSDDLAHVFVALLQEKTSAFSDSANDFYDHVEKTLMIHGALDGWRQHICFDNEHGHASDLERLFQYLAIAPVAEINQSLLSAAIAIDFLVESLDDVINKTPFKPSQVSIGAEFSHQLLQRIPRLVTSAISYCIEMPEYIDALGRILQVITTYSSPVQQHSQSNHLGVSAIINRLESIAHQPSRFYLLLGRVLTFFDQSKLRLPVNKNLMALDDAAYQEDFDFVVHACIRWDRLVRWIP